MTHPLSAQYPTTEVTLDVTPGTAHGHTLRRTPAAPPSVSPCPLAIARAPPAPLSPTPQGSGQSCCPCQGCFLLLCSSPRPLLVPLRISCCQGPWPGTHRSGPRASQQEPGAPLPPHSGWTHGIFPIQFPSLSHCPTTTPRAPGPGSPGGAPVGSLEEADSIV